MQRITGLPAPIRYAAAPVVSVLVALVQHYTLGQPEIAPFVLFAAGVAVVSWFGGLGPGLLATLISAAIANYFFTAPFNQFSLSGPSAIGTILFLVSGTIVAGFCGALRRAMEKADKNATSLRKTAAALRAREFISRGQAQLAAEVRGELAEGEVASRTLSFLARYLGAKVGVLYLLDKTGSARRVATFACADRGIGAPPESLKPGEGWIGQVAREGQLVVLPEVPDDHIKIVSATGQSRPRTIVIAPLTGLGRTVAVMELGFLATPDASTSDFLAAIAEPAGISMLSAHYRTRQQALLEETQRQAKELQTQQEELRVTNEELEEQSQALRGSQTRLEAQQAELEQTNTQLEEQAQALEKQRDQLSRSQAELVEKADELTRSNQYKSEFLANMSHELRTPLNSALILSKLLADNKDGNLTPEQVNYAATIHTSGSDLLVLINDILDLSRIEAGHMELHVESVAVGRILESLRRTFEPVASQKGLSFTVELTPGIPPSISSDGLRVEQIIRNLLSNALKFTEKGLVSLRVATAPGNQISFSVRDSGIGIAQDQQELIFEAFRQANGMTNRKYGGTGLGLTISRELARRLGGDISVESTPGNGSTFTLTIPHVLEAPGAMVESTNSWTRTSKSMESGPKSQEPLAPSAVEDDRQRLRTGQRSILIIEDDQAFACILRDLARDRHFCVLVATNAAEGLLLAERFVPSAAILDLRLPDNSGLAVLDRLKHSAKTRHIPVHVISAMDCTQQALEMGAIGFARKPIGREQLIETIQKIELRLEQKVRRVLVVEDVSVQRESIVHLLQAENVTIVPVATGMEAMQRLSESTFDCMVLDLTLPDMSGYDLLDQISNAAAFSFPPVIVYTGRALARQEEERLRRYASSIIIKGAKSPERLLDEVTLFLHQVVGNLPVEQQRILREVRNREAALEGKNILVVDDDARNVFALASVLESKGAKLRFARNGKEALAALDASDGKVIELVLMDIMMPEMDGLTATREIRKRPEWNKLPILALTAKAMPHDREECLRAGANDYIAKPLDIDKLFSLIKVWIAK